MNKKTLVSLFIILLLVISNDIKSQGGLPPFKILQKDGKLFRAQDLPERLKAL
jgi:hypothetical protein